MKTYIMRLTLLIGCTALLAACVPKSDLDTAKSEIERLRGQVSQLEKQNEELRAQVVQAVEGLTTAKARNEALQTQAGKAAEGLAAAQERLSRKPPMPVTVSLRKAMLGGGYVAVFSTTVKQDFPVLVTVRSPALGTSKQFRVQLNASGTSELGRAEGAVVDIDDELLIENANFEPATLKFRR